MSFTDVSVFPLTSNALLAGPTRLSLQEFRELPITEQQARVRLLFSDLQEAMHQLPAELQLQDRMHPVHHFLDGVYIRELTMPAETIIVGRRHSQEHMVIMIEGSCTCFTEHGQEDMSAPCRFISPAGERRVLFIHEQTTWLTVHRTDTREAAELILELTLPEYPGEFRERELLEVTA